MSDRHPVYAELAKMEKLFAALDAVDQPKVDKALDAAVFGVWGWWFGLFMPNKR